MWRFTDQPLWSHEFESKSRDRENPRTPENSSWCVERSHKRLYSWKLYLQWRDARRGLLLCFRYSSNRREKSHFGEISSWLSRDGRSYEPFCLRCRLFHPDGWECQLGQSIWCSDLTVEINCSIYFQAWNLRASVVDLQSLWIQPQVHY